LLNLLKIGRFFEKGEVLQKIFWKIVMKEYWRNEDEKVKKGDRR